MGMGASGGDGLATTPTAGGVPGEDHADNWLDIVNFGGKDAIINTYLITALNAMAEMATFLGGPNATSATTRWQRLHAKAAASFEQQFWNASASLYGERLNNFSLTFALFLPGFAPAL
jgi:glycogen debranching enzyme